ncbi:unnamed protein product [Lampetra fluviatilis]
MGRVAGAHNSERADKTQRGERKAVAEIYRERASESARRPDVTSTLTFERASEMSPHGDLDRERCPPPPTPPHRYREGLSIRGHAGGNRTARRHRMAVWNALPCTENSFLEQRPRVSQPGALRPPAPPIGAR